jgi:hypothetical protein
MSLRTSRWLLSQNVQLSVFFLVTHRRARAESIKVLRPYLTDSTRACLLSSVIGR